MNAYWEAVRPYVVDGVITRSDLDPEQWQTWRDGMRERYSWTITDPETVEFVREHLGEYAVDPFAGSGWWESLLISDMDILGYDIAPPQDRWSPVGRCDAVQAVSVTIPSTEALLLSWPPRYDDIGERTIRAYRGNRIVHIGADGSTSDGTDEMRKILAEEWTQVASHIPVRWYGVKDEINVYERA